MLYVLTTAMCLLGALNSPGWKKVHETDGIIISLHSEPGARVQEVKAEGFIDAPIDRVWQVLSDVEKYPEFMPYMLESKVIQPIDASSAHVYHKVDPPFVDARDYTLHISWKRDSRTGGYLREWKVSPAGIGPGPSKDAVRLTLSDGSWTLEPAGANRTHVIYYVYTDPGGAVPAWLANKATSVSMPDVVRALRNRSLNPTWKK